MKRQAILLMAMVAPIIMVLAACGSEQATNGGEEESVWAATPGEPYNAGSSGASLEDAGWAPMETEGVTYAEQEVGFLEVTAPDGETIDLQFLEGPEEAQSELDATIEQEAPFDGTIVGNVLVFDPDDETAEVSPDNLQALQELLMGR